MNHNAFFEEILQEYLLEKNQSSKFHNNLSLNFNEIANVH